MEEQRRETEGEKRRRWNICDCVFAADHIPQAAAAAPQSTARPSAATFTAFESSVKLTLSGREGRGYTAGWAGLRLQGGDAPFLRRDKGIARLLEWRWGSFCFKLDTTSNVIWNHLWKNLVLFLFCQNLWPHHHDKKNIFFCFVYSIFSTFNMSQVFGVSKHFYSTTVQAKNSILPLQWVAKRGDLSKCSNLKSKWH